MEISVVIPTHKRPEMLRSALSSVAAQSRLDLIREVIVSENSSDEASRRVCGEFTTLPVRHVSRQPALGVLEHFETLVAEASAPWVAWLADDDMWGRYHLEEAERGLAVIPDAVGFASACALVSNESRRIWGGEGLTFESTFWKTARGVSRVEEWNLSTMCLESLVRAPVNPWGMVCRKHALVESIQKWRMSSTAWDSDRLFMCLVTKHGSLAIGREIGLFYRRHINSAAVNLLANPHVSHKASGETTRRIIEEARLCGIDLRLHWDRAWKAMTPSQREAYLNCSTPGACQALREEWGRAVLDWGHKRTFLSQIKSACRSACPPIIWQSLSNIRAWWARAKQVRELRRRRPLEALLKL